MSHEGLTEQEKLISGFVLAHYGVAEDPCFRSAWIESRTVALSEVPRQERGAVMSLGVEVAICLVLNAFGIRHDDFEEVIIAAEKAAKRSGPILAS